MHFAVFSDIIRICLHYTVSGRRWQEGLCPSPLSGAGFSEKTGGLRYDLSGPRRHHARAGGCGGYHVRCAAPSVRQSLRPVSSGPGGQGAGGGLARRTIAGALGCQPSALHFTSCGTESDNWAIRAAAWQGRHTGRHIITTAVEHSAVLEPCRQLEQEGYEVTYLKPDRTGHISAGQVAEALREDTVLVSVMLVNNETGCHLPRGGYRPAAEGAGEPCALLHCDAVQGFLKVPCDPAGLGRGSDEPVRPQARRPQGHRRSVRPSGPAEPAAPAGRRRAGGGACAPARRPPLR